MLSLAIFLACKKETNPYFSNGSAPVLKSSTKAIAVASSDSSSYVMTLNWTNPKYATDSSTNKYIIQIDSSGRDFAKAVSFTVSGALTDSFTAKQINTVALGFGFSYNVAYNMDVRVISSYANNNEQYLSNTVTVSVTPYVIPPKIAPPANLYIVGAAVATAPGNNWNTPVDSPYQKFTRIDSVTFGGIFNITGGAQYLLLPVGNSFNNKYAIIDNTVPGSDTIGSFQAYTSGGANFAAPATGGWYEIVVNFQTATYTVKPYTGPPVPLAVTPNPTTLATGLWVIGNATPENPSWTNDPVSLASQQFKQLSNGDFQITIALNSSGGYVFLPAAGDWTNKYGGTAAAGGPILYDGSVPGSNTPGPAVSGNYLIDVNFVTGKYTLTPQ
jgi:starch-binding outer membrane protein SusE/F